jgi:acetate kinase
MALILIVNAGSSTLKYTVFDGARLVRKGQVSDLTNAGHQIARWLSETGLQISEFAGVGHRIVHGGTQFIEPTRVDERTLAELRGLSALAPLHMPFGLEVLAEMRRLMPGVPHVACFDTAFHAAQPDIARRLPLPRDYHGRGYQRYGFHGLSYEHVVASFGENMPKRLLIAHLGNGSSMCAVLDGKSVATTMGFSTADGLVMGTRSGSIDPGVLIALMRDEKLNADQLEDLLYRRSGLRGVSGITSDMRELLASKEQAAAEAVDYYCYHAARHAGSLAVAMGGLDAIAFTGGIGENSEIIRDKILAHLSWLPAQVHIVPANEELAIAKHVNALLLQ